MAYKSWDERVAERIAIGIQERAAKMGYDIPVSETAKEIASKKVADYNQRMADNQSQRTWDKANGTPPPQPNAPVVIGGYDYSHEDTDA